MSERKKKMSISVIIDAFNDTSKKCHEDQYTIPNNCNKCNSLFVISDEGFRTCIICGIIDKNTLDQCAEWRFFGSDDCGSSDPSRCGMPINPLLQSSSLSCRVLPGRGSSYEMLKIRRYTEYQSMPYTERSRHNDFQRIVTKGNESGIPKLIIDDAMYYYHKISEVRTFRGLNRDGIIAASLYVAARVNHYPRTSHEIAHIFNLDTSSATKGCKRAVMILNEIENDLHTSDKTTIKQTTPMSFIERFCSKLLIPQDIIKICVFATLMINKNNLIPENTPQSIAAGIIYFVSSMCNMTITRKDVSVVTDISEVTINKCYKKLLTIESDIIPRMVLEKYKK
uniref:Cyclin-like domain-containing protein n=1 Tax=viral metagenome TaxID=1070528 RepID=A0A6C0BQT0_9ZZZZ